MRVVVNGAPRELPDGTTVAGLLAVLGLERAPVVVERNGGIVRRAEQAATALCDADRVEVVRLVAGG